MNPSAASTESPEAAKPAALVEVKVASPDFDPMKFMEIKSAVQWKQMNERISWKFETDKENVEQNKQPIAAAVKKKVNLNQMRRREEITYDLKRVVFPSDPDGFTPTKVQQLRLVCWRMKPWNNNNSSGKSKLFNSQVGG